MGAMVCSQWPLPRCSSVPSSLGCLATEAPCSGLWGNSPEILRLQLPGKHGFQEQYPVNFPQAHLPLSLFLRKLTSKGVNNSEALRSVVQGTPSEFHGKISLSFLVFTETGTTDSRVLESSSSPSVAAVFRPAHCASRDQRSVYGEELLRLYEH